MICERESVPDAQVFPWDCAEPQAQTYNFLSSLYVWQWQKTFTNIAARARGGGGVTVYFRLLILVNFRLYLVYNSKFIFTTLFSVSMFDSNIYNAVITNYYLRVLNFNVINVKVKSSFNTVSGFHFCVLIVVLVFENWVSGKRKYEHRRAMNTSE